MSRIDGLIGTQAYELIRVKIGSILYTELANQVILGGDYSIDADIYVERDIPFDRTELPAINIALPNGEYDNKHQGVSRGTYVYNIECYMGAKSNNDTMGDVLANVKLQKLVGIIRAILENPVYKFLDFEPPFVSKTFVRGFQNGKVNNSDGGFNVVSVISFEVVCNETTALLDGLDFDSMCTVMKLGLTDKGYLFCSGEHTPIPPINPCSDGRIFINSVEEFSVASGGVINILLEDLNGLEIIPTSIYGNIITIDTTGGTCNPATYDLNDEYGHLISSGSIDSGDSAIIVAPNADIDIVDSAANVLYPLSLLSDSTNSQVITDSTVNITDSASTLLYAKTVLAQATDSQVITDSVATLKDTANNTISTTNLLAQGTANITAPDATVTYNNGTALTTVKSNETKDIDFVYVNGNTATPNSLVGTLFTFPNPQANYDPRDLLDFFTLNWTNPFGNNNRFTDIVGTQVYAVAAVIDWTTYKISAGTVLVISSNISLIASGTYAAAVTAYSTLNLGGLIGFQPIKFIYLVDLFNPSFGGYNYSPFNYLSYTGWGTSSFIRSGTTYISATSKMGVGNVPSFLQLLDAATVRTMGSRLTTLAELGL